MWEQPTQCGGWESVSSPLFIPDYVSASFFSLVAYDEKGILPGTGGLFDQMPWFIESLKLMRMTNSMATKRAKEIEERNEKLKHKAR